MSYLGFAKDEIQCVMAMVPLGKDIDLTGFCCVVALYCTLLIKEKNSLQALGCPLGKMMAYLGFVIWLLTVTGTVTYF